MLGKIEIFIVIVLLVFLFYIVISLGAGRFSKKKKTIELNKYLKSVNSLLILIIAVGAVLILFL